MSDVLRRFGADAEVHAGVPAGGRACRLAGPPAAATVVARDEAAVAGAIAAAREHGWVLAARGGGSRDRWGGPIRRGPLVVLDLRALRGVVAHEPGDLTIRVRPGTAVHELNAGLGEHGQVLAATALGAGPATVGGMVAADAWGAARWGLGGPRDALLGLRVVDGAGRAFAAGGHVVKNVSGLDIGKLFVGSFGSLGVITELSLKLRPRAPQQAWWGARFAVPAAAWAAVRRILEGGFQPVGIALDERGEGTWLSLSLQGGHAEVRDQLGRLPSTSAGGTGLLSGEAQAAWEAAHRVEPDADLAVAVRCEVPDGELEPLAREVASLREGLRRVAWPGLGVLWCVWDGPQVAGAGAGVCLDLVRRLRDLAGDRGGRAVVAGCPDTVRGEAAPFGDPGELGPWYSSVKARFDPDGVLAPGRFVGGL